MDEINSVRFELESMVCPAGYEVASIKIREGDIDSLGSQKPKLVKVVVPREPDLQEQRVTENFSAIWKQLIVLNNLRRVTREATQHSLILRCCETYGLPVINGTATGTFDNDNAYVDSIFFEAFMVLTSKRNHDRQGNSTNRQLKIAESPIQKPDD